MSTHERIHTRQAIAEDADAIAAMHHALARHCNYPESQFRITPAAVQATISNPDSYERYLVAEDEFVDTHEIGGFAYISKTLSSWNGARGVYIEDLFVWPEFRGNYNIGTSLLSHAAHIAIDYADGNPDRAFLRLDTANRNNDATLRFYEGKGFDTGTTNLRLGGEALKELVNLGAVTD